MKTATKEPKNPRFMVERSLNKTNQLEQVLA